MRASLSSVLVATLLFVGASAAQAQSTDTLLGTWLFDENVMYEDPAGGGIVQKTVSAELRLEQKGDSVFGVWQVELPGRPASRTEMRGVIKDGTLRLRTGPQQARLSGPDGDRTIETWSEYVLTLSGSQITGRVDVTSSDDMVSIPSRSISGRRPA